jgi:hypothetical protein
VKDDAMTAEFHLSDEDILLVADGETTGRRAKQARAHLAACWFCRARLSELESTIAEFISFHRSGLDAQLPPVAGSRALLKARLAEASTPPQGLWQRWFDVLVHARAAALVCVLVLACTLLLRFWTPHGLKSAKGSQVALIPDPELTPGAVRRVALPEVCAMPHEEVVAEVPDSLRQEVFEEYGLANARPQDYEIDYLIAPGLGGTQDIHNLWPEPSTTSGWNAHVKDLLEERLHQLVCDGQVDLPTAQQAIANDWITAYKKYLGTAATSEWKFSPGLAQNRFGL